MNLLIFVFLLGSVSFSGNACAQTVEEMFLDIPASLIGLENGSTPVARKKLIDTLDVKNGFIALKGESGTEFAKFTLRGRGPLLAAASSSYADGRALVKPLMFFEKKSSGWSDVSSSFVPEIPGMVIDAFQKAQCGVAVSDSASGTYRYHLPRKGRTIVAVAESDVLKKPCKGDLFHLDFEEVPLPPNNSWYAKLVLTTGTPCF